jgi:hypothetical protein
MSTLTPFSPQTAPSTRPRWLAAGAVVVLGVLVGLAWSTVALLRMVDRPAGFARTTVPGSVSVQLARGERSVVYIESDRSTTLPALTVTVTGPNGATVTTHPIRGDLVYDVPDQPNRLGNAVGSFDANTAGTYTVTTPTEPAGDPVLTVGTDLAGGVAWALAAPGAFVLGTLVLAGVLGATPSARRRRDNPARRPPIQA